MSTTSRKVLRAVGLGLGLFVLAGGCCVGGSYLWYSGNADRIRRDDGDARAEAESFGRSNNQRACVDEGLHRSDACTSPFDLFCEPRARSFTTWCLDAAAPMPELCAGVPRSDEIVASANWGLRYCAEHGRAQSQPCTRLVRAVQEHCDRR